MGKITTRVGTFWVVRRGKMYLSDPLRAKWGTRPHKFISRGAGNTGPQIEIELVRVYWESTPEAVLKVTDSLVSVIPVERPMGINRRMIRAKL